MNIFLFFVIAIIFLAQLFNEISFYKLDKGIKKIDAELKKKR